MASSSSLDNGAREAYETIAPVYDALTGDYPHGRWLARLEQLARAQGLAGRRLLDVACGTGSSFLPMLDWGYEVTGCDVSARMLDLARAKAPQVPLHLADMRALPTLGRFDLITCLDDPLNYVLDESELLATLQGFARNLSDAGIVLWDLNTVAQYRGQFATDRVIAEEARFIAWNSGPREHEACSGDVVEVSVEIFARLSGDVWRRSTSIHRQRHWPRDQIEALCADAGLRLLEVRGQRPGAILDSALNELVHTKAIYLASLC